MNASNDIEKLMILVSNDWSNQAWAELCTDHANTSSGDSDS